MKNQTQYLLIVQTETKEHPWHATLERVSAQNLENKVIELLEFSSPVALAQHLANVGTEGQQRHGLR
jgi:hypothetical protein